MLYSIKNKEGLEQLEELASLQIQVKVVRLQDRLGKKNFQEDMEKVFEPVTNTIRDVSEEVTKAIAETSIKNNKALDNLNQKNLMNYKGMIAPYLASSLVNLFEPENTSQIKFKKTP